MASIIKVDTIQDQDGNNIINENANTITIGASGDTITIPSGATITNNGTQTGFGRTGTVDWQTGSIKTGTFTAVNGEGYFINTTGGVATMTLPASPSAGDIVSCKDYAYTFGTNSLTVGRNGSPIGGDSGNNPTFTTNGTALTLIYVDATRGWLVINESTNTTEAQTIPTGGTTVESGGYRYHTFTSSSDFIIPTGQTHTVEYLIIAAGGGGGTGGGGAGGMQNSSASLGAGTYAVVVGGGGAGGLPGSDGGDSSFNSVTSTGGGGGGSGSTTTGGSGGSGGGGHGGWSGGPGTGGSGTPGQGNGGGDGNSSPGGYATGGGGGGKDGAGSNGTGSGGDGGAGGSGSNSFSTWASATSTGDSGYYAGGGGGAGFPGTSNGGGAGGAGGGGDGGGDNTPSGDAGATVANTGGGGGGSYYTTSNGADGIVILRYTI
jgi:hypothetical protein